MLTAQFDLVAKMVERDLLSDEGDYLGPVTPETLHYLVTERVAYLLEHNFYQLMTSLYQIDVPEEEVQQAFASNSRASVPAHLATLIIQREVQKAESRSQSRYSAA